jgi:hypothetical protein
MTSRIPIAINFTERRILSILYSKGAQDIDGIERLFPTGGGKLSDKLTPLTLAGYVEDCNNGFYGLTKEGKEWWETQQFLKKMGS